MKKIWFAVFLLAGVLLLASCAAGAEGPQGPPGPAGPGLEPTTQTFDVYMGEQEATGTTAMEELLLEDPHGVLIAHFFRWEPRVLVALKGDTIVLNVFNPSDVIHGLEIPVFRVDTGPMAPGTDTTVEFVADKAGTFEFRCSTPYSLEADPQVCHPDHDFLTGTLIVLDR